MDFKHLRKSPYAPLIVLVVNIWVLFASSELHRSFNVLVLSSKATTTLNDHLQVINIHDSSHPLISFIIPTTLQRETLNNTIECLQNMTNPDWEALLGVDVQVSPHKTMEEMQQRLSHFNFKQDARIKLIPIDTNFTNRGRFGNGAGEVRNLLIQHASAPWVAMVDGR